MKDRKQYGRSEVAPLSEGYTGILPTHNHRFSTLTTQLHIRNHLSRVSPTFPHPTLHMIHIDTGILESAAVVE